MFVSPGTTNWETPAYAKIPVVSDVLRGGYFFFNNSLFGRGGVGDWQYSPIDNDYLSPKEQQLSMLSFVTAPSMFMGGGNALSQNSGKALSFFLKAGAIGSATGAAANAWTGADPLEGAATGFFNGVFTAYSLTRPSMASKGFGLFATGFGTSSISQQAQSGEVNYVKSLFSGALNTSTGLFFSSPNVSQPIDDFLTAAGNRMGRLQGFNSMLERFSKGTFDQRGAKWGDGVMNYVGSYQSDAKKLFETGFSIFSDTTIGAGANKTSDLFGDSQ